MRIDRIASVFGVKPLRSAGLLRPKAGIPILMYHSVSDDPEPGVGAYYRVATSPERFRQQMQCLYDHHYEVLSLSEALRRLAEGVPSTSRCVVLTFDDGFDDFRTNAWPVLAEFNFTATMFVPTAFIGQARRSFRGRDCLTWGDVRQLCQNGIQFGAHTVNHPVLHGMSWANIRRELHESRLRIEDEIQEPVRLFAYPYAFPQEDRRFVTRIKTEIAAEGYQGAVTTVLGRALMHAEPFALKRLPVNECDDRALFVGKLEGLYDWVGGLQLLIRRSRQFRDSFSRVPKVSDQN